MSASDILFTWIPHFFYSQLFVTPKYPTQDCTGKTIIVTGANVSGEVCFMYGAMLIAYFVSRSALVKKLRDITCA